MALRILSDREFALVISDYALLDGFAAEFFEREAVDPERFILVSGHRPSELSASVPTTVPHFLKPIDIGALDLALSKILGPAQPAAPRQTSAYEAPSHDLGKERVELCLYLHSGTSASAAAETNLQNALADFDTTRLQLESIDLARSPRAAHPEDKVVFTPTLVRRGPGSRLALVGDLGDRALLDSVLLAAGLSRNA